MHLFEGWVGIVTDLLNRFNSQGPDWIQFPIGFIKRYFSTNTNFAWL